MIDALRSYLQLASGLAEMTAEKAKETATMLVSQGFEVGTKGQEIFGQQVQGIADDIVAQSRTNREILLGLIQTEIDRNIGRMGFVREEELAAVRGHLQRLEKQLNAGSSLATGVAGKAASTARTATKAAAATARTATRSAAGAVRSAPIVSAPRASAKPAAKKAAPRKTGAKTSASNP